MGDDFIGNYQRVEEIGQGSFGNIWKVRRTSDGQIFAGKKLNFERMSDQGRRRVVAEVHDSSSLTTSPNILKDLRHDHIVRYVEQYVDNDAGFLYILMEYCGGGDLSTVIKRAARQNIRIPEDAVWKYFMQTLLALKHCHNTGGGGTELRGKEGRMQLLHRDLKPENGTLLFLDYNNTVKLGDFGLATSVNQGGFAETYAGTPYYMSPELIQGKSYDHKTDIWSLGCLIYELCALKPLFHAAKTQSELNSLILNCQKPALPRGYSHAMGDVITAMLVRDPAMRPSAAELLNHERVRFASKAQNLLIREFELKERESAIHDALQNKNAEIQSLQLKIREYQAHLQRTGPDAIQAAVERREREISGIVQRKEQETMEAFRRHEIDLLEALDKREEAKKAEIRLLQTKVHQYEAQLQISGPAAMQAALMSREREIHVIVQRKEVEIVEAFRQRERGLVEIWRGGMKLCVSSVGDWRNCWPDLQVSVLREQRDRTDFSQKTDRPFLDAVRNILDHQRTTSPMKDVVLTATGEVIRTPSPENPNFEQVDYGADSIVGKSQSPSELKRK
ncbi:kinase-like domain-containing protein [Mycena olivaceomarginata]|nr:kinase-like domain-containing protein [Mycena olivaceomarginata]